MVGKAPECRMRLIDRAVSRFHCSLLRTTAGLFVIDLFGRGGIVVNGQRVRCSLLDEADLLQVGTTLIRVRYGEPATGADRHASSSSASWPGWSPGTHGSKPSAFGRPLESTNTLVPWAPLPSPSLSRSNDIPSHVEAEVIGSYLAHLTDQFGQMQQQLFDQFQQTLLMMARRFDDLKRERMDLILDKMDQIAQINKDVREIQAHLAKQQPNQAPTLLPDSSVDRVDISRRERNQVLTHGHTHTTRTAYLVEASRPEPGRRSEFGSNVTSANAKGRRLGEEKEGSPPLSPAAPIDGLSSSPPVEEIHALLFRRLNDLHQEQQGHWQKLVHRIVGR